MNALRISALLAAAVIVEAAFAQTGGSPAPRPAVAAPAPATASAPAGSPATGPAGKPISAKDAQNKTAAQESYDKVVGAYMKEDWSGLADELKASGRYNDAMTPSQRLDISYIRTAAPEHHPAWWQECRKTSNVSFGARIWGKDFTANYMPSDTLGMEMPVDIKNGRMVVVVSWKPSLVDNPKPAEGTLAEKFGLTRAHIGEAIVWHELGHNYLTLSLPANTVIDLYNNHALLYSHLQEFFADMTALYHSGPKGRLTTLMMRIDELEDDSTEEGHCRMALGIASIIMANVLADPAKWPSIHLPPAVPDKDVERKTAIYLYEHIDPSWTLAEDKALRDMVQKFIFSKGDATFRSRGEIQLANNLSYKLMAADDRDFLPKRETWIAAQLKKAIDAGQADKPVPTSTSGRFFRSRIVMPY